MSSSMKISMAGLGLPAALVLLLCVHLGQSEQTTLGPPEKHQCQSWQQKCDDKVQCVDKIKFCDGRAHCDDGSDERGCENYQCRPGWQKCADNRECVLKSLICDGDDDCSDGSDEQGCGESTATLRPTTPKPLPPVTSPAPPTVDEVVTVRLVGGLPHSGTVEVTRAGVTGVICDDSWDLSDGHVVCRMLGYKAAESVTQRNKFNYTTEGETFLMDDVHCTGEETNLAQCGHCPWGTNNCEADELAGVTCVADKPEC